MFVYLKLLFFGAVHTWWIISCWILLKCLKDDGFMSLTSLFYASVIIENYRTKEIVNYGKLGLVRLPCFWPRAMLKGHKRSFVVVVLGVKSWAKNVPKRTKNVLVSQNEVRKVPTAMAAKCYLLWHIMVLNCRVYLVWPYLTLNEWPFIWPRMVLLLFMAMVMCGLIWLSIAFCDLVWSCIALYGLVMVLIASYGRM